MYLRVAGELFSPEEFTQLVGIEPTAFGLKGGPGKYRKNLESFWEYKLKKTDALEGVEDGLSALIKLFEGKAGKICQYTHSHTLCIKIFVVIESKNRECTGVSLHQDFITFLNKIGACFEVDTYDYND